MLHWNLEQFSNNKLNNINGPALIDYIAKVVSQRGANLISLLELKNSAVNNILAQLIPAINLANGVPVNANPWSSIHINSLKNNEAYVLLYDTGHNFDFLMPAAGGGVPISGLTNQALVGGVPGGVLRFNSSLTTSGGRRPYYVTFHTADTNHTFAVIAYHTMFGFWSDVGVRNCGLLGQTRAVLDVGVGIPLDASLTSGDFNVDFVTDPTPYNNLLNHLPASQSTNELTSLVNFTPPGGFANSLQYRKNAYDNIFKYNVAGLPPAGGGIVTDLIDDSTTIAGGGTGALTAEIQAFDRAPIPLGNLIQNIPPDDYEDAWHIVRHAISNHLPVSVTVAI